MKVGELEKSLHHLRLYIESEKFKGYDPYDVLNTPIPLVKMGKWAPIIATQIQKRNPFNIRPLIGIKKEYNPKGLGLMLHAYSLLSEIEINKYNNQISQLLQLLDEQKTKGYSGTCWGYNFGWASPEKYLAPYSPTSVVTGFICKALFSAYEATGSEEIKKTILAIAPFVLNDLGRTQDATGICISYSTEKNDCCYNASLLAGEIISILYVLSGNEEYKKIAIQTVDFVISKQHPDGHWAYSKNLLTGTERTQTDFHQGYIIESIYTIISRVNYSNKSVNECLKLGMDFYLNKQFSSEGRSYFRLPKEFPTDVHHQAQGIITICRYLPELKKNLPFAEKMASWAIENMQDKKSGAFIYRKGAYFNDNTKYIRWGQAWMFLALSELAKAKSSLQ